MKGLCPAFLCGLLATAAPAQLASTVGPPVTPVGCPIAIAISNDTSAVLWTGICPFEVRTAAGVLVPLPACPAIARQIPPGGTFFTFWDQVDGFGNQVPPGAYVIEVGLAGGVTQSHNVTIDPRAQGGVVNLGVVRPGTTRQLYACTPGAASSPYMMGAALSANRGIATCGGVFPLDPDPLLAFSLAPNTVFTNFTGSMSRGTTTDPAIALPAIPTLSGLPLHVAFFAFVPSAACPFSGFSEPTTIVIQ